MNFETESFFSVAVSEMPKEGINFLFRKNYEKVREINDKMFENVYEVKYLSTTFA